jgi:hypothetical protein
MPSWINKPDPFGQPYKPPSQGTAISNALQNMANSANKIAQRTSAYQPTPVYANQVGNYSQPMQVPPQVPGNIQDINAYLGQDTGYQNQVRDYDKALQDFLADVTRRRGTLETEFGLSNKAMDDQRLKDLEALKDDFGARGILRSGLYADEVGNYETEFGQRKSDLSRRNTDALSGLTQEEGSFKSQAELKKNKAREDAIARRAAQYGI